MIDNIAKYKLPTFKSEGDQSWRLAAACRGADLNLFFPQRGGSLIDAYEMCDRCPVATECLANGMTECAGVWGGASRLERRRLLGENVKKRMRPRSTAQTGGAL